MVYNELLEQGFELSFSNPAFLETVMIQSRYRRILWFFAGVLLSLFWWDILLPWLGLSRFSTSTRSVRLVRVAANFRALAITMGGVMIKVGQFLSARLDVLPHEIINELSDLQDEVRPESFEAIRAVIEEEMQAPLGSRFADFEPTPLASASIGQVHRARLLSGEEVGARVVVKVQRPKIEQIVETDLSALRVVARWIQLYPPVNRRVNMPALMEEFSRSLREETDYLNEGKNGETFAANFAHRPGVRVPRIFWSHTTRRVLTQEEIQAIKISDYAAIEAAGIDRAEVANRLLDTYLQQIFEDRFFHADPHPGNLFVLPAAAGSSQPGTWELVFVDFGMTGSVPANLFQGLREMLLAVGTRDVRRMVKSYQQLGVLLPGADTSLLEKAGERLFDQFWGKSTTEIVSMGQQQAAEFAREFGDLLFEMPFQIPENIILLGRCLGILSGICSGLNKDFNVWDRLMPYTRNLIETEDGASTWFKEAAGMLQMMVSLPRRTEAVLQRIEQGELEVQFPDLQRQFMRLERGLRRLSGAILCAAFLSTATQLYLAGEIRLAIAALVVTCLFLIWAFTAR